MAYFTIQQDSAAYIPCMGIQGVQNDAGEIFQYMAEGLTGYAALFPFPNAMFMNSLSAPLALIFATPDQAAQGLAEFITNSGVYAGQGLTDGCIIYEADIQPYGYTGSAPTSFLWYIKFNFVAL